jgi:hypothetical protein
MADLTGAGLGHYFTDIETAGNVTIWVKWPPNLASFAAAFCSLRTHARQGPNLGPLPLRELANLGPTWAFVQGARFGL